ncbi:MAG: RNA-guided pseudouridylation complex pseudouridine synthase subunit Cbf5, partial [Candidatus Heimdallarchaeota archaeon]|nr:RNA-guided pseudouridylation complex pseudouridine synthase subunit Cbf5 [Candidatus Heimdallarchaeota archaeon]
MTLIFSPPKLTFDDKQSLKVLSRDVTDFKWGKMPSARTIDELLNYGIINLDKPPNPTSHEVVSYVKRILNIPKAGHSGTLDPQVTGILPTALGKATRILDTLLLAGKEYVGNMRIHADV